MVVKTAEVRARIEQKLKKESARIFKKLGLSESEGVRLLLKGMVLHRGFPFELKIPNEETRKAIEDIEKGNTIGPFNSIEEMVKELNS
ncbi:MAG: type II toxin-antitoxin system RelB/DinJ family antitoxin [Bacteroidota bacterium]